MAGSMLYKGPSTAGSFSTFGRFFRWWAGELYDLIPLRWRPLPVSAKRFHWLELTATSAVVHALSGGRLAEAGRVEMGGLDGAARKLAFEALFRKLGRKPVGLCLPAESVLRKRITLPLAAKDRLRQVVGFELARHTPFNADQARFDYRIEAIDRNKATLDVTLTVAARRQLDEWVALLGQCGVETRAIVPIDDLASTARYANLRVDDRLGGMSWYALATYGAMIALPVLLIAAYLAIPIVQKREIAIALIQQANVARQQAARIDGLRTELDAVSGDYQFLLERKFRHPAMVAVLEEVTRLLPDHTWLTQLEVKGADVLMSGETSSSSELVRVIEKSGLLADASFKSPLVKGRNNIERFQLAARLREADFAGLAVRHDGRQPAKPDAGRAATVEGARR